MTTQFTEAPIFDADQHMYETPDSLTKYLPEKYSRAVQFAPFGRQTRIVINNRVNDFIPTRHSNASLLLAAMRSSSQARTPKG